MWLGGYQKTTVTSCMACHSAQAQENDFVWFLPLGAYPQEPDPCQAVSAFTKAAKAVPLAKTAPTAAENGQTKAANALRKYFAEHPPSNQ
jgi:hypothetical protein